MEVSLEENEHTETPSPVLGPLERILLSLEGTVILEKPRVSRDVIIEVLREHTELIRELQ